MRRRDTSIASLAALAMLSLIPPALCQDDEPDPLLDGLEPGIYARVETTAGAMVWRLHEERAPNAVYNFVTLSQGLRSWTDPVTKESKRGRFYDDMPIHRVAPGVLIQTGSPTGEGDAGPGYTFRREVHPELRHDDAGVVSMLTTDTAAAHGSQLFITLAPTPNLDGQFAIFARVVRGKDVLLDLGSVEIDEMQRPKRPLRIKAVTIHRRGEAARAWDPVATARKEVPAPSGEADPARAPAPLEAPSYRAPVQFIAVHFRGLERANLYCPYSREEARGVAERIAALARQRGADFAELEARYSDEPLGGKVVTVRPEQRGLEAVLSPPKGPCPAYRLGLGQVSEPFETPLGWVILHRPPTVMARHILIGWEGGPFGGVTRSKERAQILAVEARERLLAGTPFIELLQTYHDPLKVEEPARGRADGRSADLARHELAPVGEVAFGLEPGAVSEVVEAPQGYLIVQRIAPLSARHILIGWAGNKRLPGISRSKAEARELAASIAKRLRSKEARFEELLGQSDDKVTPGGAYRDFAPDHMVIEFSRAALALEPGEVSEVVESPYGFHIIERLRGSDR